MPYSLQLERRHKPRSGLTLGGIGTGGIELYPDGIFRNWHIFNNKPFGTGNRFPFPEDSMLFFLIRYQEPGKHPRLKLLQIEEGLEAAGIELQPYIFPWLAGVETIQYQASFPFAHLTFTDQDMPLVVELEAFSPFIPHDVKNSSLPAVIFNLRVTSVAPQPVDVTLLASLRSGVGYDVKEKRHVGQIKEITGGRLLEMTCGGMPEDHPSFGWQALASLSPASSYYLGWAHHHPYYEVLLRDPILPDRDLTEQCHQTDPVTGRLNGLEKYLGTLATFRSLAPQESLQHTFLYGWNLPNLYTEAKEAAPARLVGNYYTNWFPTAAAVLEYVHEHLEPLTSQTDKFHQAFYDSSLDKVVLDQVNSQLNTFISSNWLTRDGTLAIHEGITPASSWGPMSTIDVALYGGISVLSLFPSLDQSMWRAHCRLQKETGEVSHGIDRNFEFFEPERPGVPSRIDLQAQFTILLLRNAFWSGDIGFLREVWPAVLRAIKFAISERDLDGDGIPDMGGVNSSYDNLAMYGATAYVGSIWLSALDHVVEAARLLGDERTRATYQALREQAALSLEQRLWNGEYYRLYNDLGNAPTQRVEAPPLDEGCFTDQVIGQWCNRLPGLTPLVCAERIQPLLKRIFLQNLLPGLGLRNCSWPEDPFVHPVPAGCWWDQANTMWSGTELAFASLLMYEGLTDQALQLIRIVDERYQRLGLYYNHIEWGGHYFRAQSAWSILNAALGLAIHQGSFRFAPKLKGNQVKLFFACPGGTAHYQHNRQEGEIALSVVSGQLVCRTLSFAGWDAASPGASLDAPSWNGQADFSPDEAGFRVSLAHDLAIQAGQSLYIRGLIARDKE